MTSYQHGDEAEDELSTSDDSGLSPLDASETVTQFTLNLNEIYLTQQPRRYFDKEAMVALVESIKQHGILQPLLVRPVAPGEYELVAGERRYRAALAAGLTQVPVHVRSLSDSEAVQFTLIENLQREDLNPVEEVEGILQLLVLKLGIEKEAVISLLNKIANVKRGFTDNVVRKEIQIVQEVFNAIGRLSPESFRTHRLPLLNLPEDILKELRSGKIAYTKAKALARVKDDLSRKLLLEKAITNNLSLNEIQKSIKALTPAPKPSPLKQQFESTYRQAQKAQVWSDPKKQDRLESLLAELNSLIGNA